MKMLTSVLVLLLCLSLCAQEPAHSDPQETDQDFALQGEYAGAVIVDGQKTNVGVQVVALGEGEFLSVGYIGGLPGAGWDGSDRHEHKGKRVGDKILFEDDVATGEVTKAGMTVSIDGQDFLLKKAERKSPTLGKKPPSGAVVLFDGSTTDHWKNGKVENGLLVQGTTSIPTFQDHKLHIEFRLPYQPTARGQARGNSGIYLQGRYEVQMLDSFGLQGKHNECGGIYSIKDPDVNMCLPPLTWQTYDIEFTAARYDQNGTRTAHPKITVRHNGVIIHKDVELPKSTTAAPMKPGPEPGPVYLQDHGNPVRYRNIWVQEL